MIRKLESEAEQNTQLNKAELEKIEVSKNNEILNILELLEDRHNFYVVMQLVTGGNLLERFTRMGQFRED